MDGWTDGRMDGPNVIESIARGEALEPSKTP